MRNICVACFILLRLGLGKTLCESLLQGNYTFEGALWKGCAFEKAAEKTEEVQENKAINPDSGLALECEPCRHSREACIRVLSHRTRNVI